MRTTYTFLAAAIAFAGPVTPWMTSTSLGAPVVVLAGDKPDAEALGAAFRELKISEHRVRVAERSLESAEISARMGVHLAERELEMARFDREKFDDLIRPRRIAERELQLQGSKDRAREAAEELLQIEIMYGDQDLDDKTAEFVINRGRRSAERSARDVELQERALEAFVSYELRKESDKLELDVEKKEHALESARRNGETEVLQKQIGLMEAQSKLESEQAKVAKLKKELASEGEAAAPEEKKS